MKIRNIFGLLVIVIVCSCIHKKSKDGEQIAIEPIQQHTLKRGLRISNGINRGMAFTNALGDKYAITYIPITVINDSTVPIDFKLAFSNEYDFPIPIVMRNINWSFCQKYWHWMEWKLQIT